jgi:WhiB family transcriptional regulator, redox-sensing transcriptional regulator
VLPPSLAGWKYTPADLDDDTWRNDAACQDLPDDQIDALFFPDVPRGATPDWEPGRAVCAACPVAVDCLNWALTVDERHGMWGALAPAERQRVRRLHAVPEPARVCGTRVGTHAGYQAHWRAGQEACSPCLQAHRHTVAAQRRDAATA